jgi:hypothetical protein
VLLRRGRGARRRGRVRAVVRRGVRHHPHAHGQGAPRGEQERLWAGADAVQHRGEGRVGVRARQHDRQ